MEACPGICCFQFYFLIPVLVKYNTLMSRVVTHNLFNFNELVRMKVIWLMSKIGQLGFVLCVVNRILLVINHSVIANSSIKPLLNSWCERLHCVIDSVTASIAPNCWFWTAHHMKWTIPLEPPFWEGMHWSWNASPLQWTNTAFGWIPQGPF